MGFSVVPLRLSTYFGYMFSAISILGALFIIIRKIMNPSMAIGWPSMMVAICFFGGLIMLFLGLIGEYLGRMFLGMSRQPQFVVREVITGESLSMKKAKKNTERINDLHEEDNDTGSRHLSGSPD